MSIKNKGKEKKGKEKKVIEMTKEERSKIANEIEVMIGMTNIGDFPEIKRLLVILKLFVDHGREHVELLGVRGLADRVLDIKLFNNRNKHSTVVLRNTGRNTQPSVQVR